MKPFYDNESGEIYNCDCLGIMKLPDIIADKSIDLMITDPPYEFISKNPRGGGFMSKENKKHLVELDESFGMTFDPEKFLLLARRKLKKFNAYIFTNKNLLWKYIKFSEKFGYKWDLLIWSKPNPVPINNGHYLLDKEYIVFIHETGATFNSDLGYKNYFTVRNVPIGKRQFNHPTVKPLNMVEDFIYISSKNGDIVMDPYLGSGTTAIAARNLKRKFIGIEIKKEYCELAINRLSQSQLF